ncbi:MAG: hypothetical protein E7E23_21555 [Paenibacillus sp.]|uniref:hypothetical protein n=1 Tax=Paenibacillus sp. TaxID=58172 RepID=UPI0029024F0E|nr:hypothetical protein [Paenibacillus sp.]MDU2243157.1 hypothetical protein [Paenibacillus sp.]
MRERALAEAGRVFLLPAGAGVALAGGGAEVQGGPHREGESPISRCCPPFALIGTK